jgi:hypothetical protein
MLKEAAVAYFKVLSRYFPRVTEKETKILESIADLQGEI